MSTKNIFSIIVALCALALVAYVLGAPWSDDGHVVPPIGNQVIDGLPVQVTLSGTFLCLLHGDPRSPKTEECAFGFKTDDGRYYAVNFGQSATAMEQFQSRAHIVADGFVVPKEALSTDHWNQYQMEGIFTITTVLKTNNP